MTSSARELPIVTQLPAWLLRRIGSIVSQHAILEWRLSRIIYTLLGVDPKAGRLTVREPRTTDRFDMICDLMKLKKLKTQTDLAALRKALDRCATQRDAVAHGLWVRNPDHPGIIFLRVLSGNWTPPGERGKHKRRIHPEAPEYSPEEAQSLLDLIEGTIQAVYDLEAEIVAALKT